MGSDPGSAGAHKRALAELVLAAVQMLLAKEPPKGRAAAAVQWNRVGLSVAEMTVAIRQSARWEGRAPPSEADLELLGPLLYDASRSQMTNKLRRKLQVNYLSTSCACPRNAYVKTRDCAGDKKFIDTGMRQFS